MYEKINLHGVTHDEVRWLLIKKIESLWETNTELDIITGYSEHMKSIVIEILNEYDLEYQIGDFLGTNKGFIKTFL